MIPQLVSYSRLLILVGLLGTSLPAVLWGGNAFLNETNLLNNPNLIIHCTTTGYTPGCSLKSSISHFYYTSVGELFTGILLVMAIILFTYQGYKNKAEFFTDNLVTNTAAIAALGVIIFPTYSESCISDSLRTFQSTELIGRIHFTFAGIFLGALAMMSIVNFRRRSPEHEFGTRAGDELHLWCGIGMILAMILIALYSFWLVNHFPEQGLFQPVFWLEWIALICFGVSWIFKARWMVRREGMQE